MEDLHGHASPHCFQATQTKQNFYKNWSDEPWCADKDAITLFKVYLFVHVHELSINNYDYCPVYYTMRHRLLLSS